MDYNGLHFYLSACPPTLNHEVFDKKHDSA